MMQSAECARPGATAKGPDGRTANPRANARAIPTPITPRTLRRWPVPRENEILFLPLGGVGQIGMNWTLYGTAGRWLLVDAGLAFPDDAPEGVDAIIPDPAVLAPILDRIDGLVVTHAHEDHIGAIGRVFPNALNCPIHATPFAAEVITRRLSEAGTLRDVDLRRFPVGGSFRVGPFTVGSVRMTHSVPEPVAFAVSAAPGTILHTGDWKFDPDPLIGEPTDFGAIRALGDAGLLAMACDSTNADRDLPVTSEAQVRETFRRIAASRKGTVVFCCFSSNVARVASAAVAAAEAGRKTALAGRSMRANEEVASALGMFAGVPDFLAEPSHLRGLDPRETALVCTGTQGEERAALA